MTLGFLVFFRGDPQEKWEKQVKVEVNLQPYQNQFKIVLTLLEKSVALYKMSGGYEKSLSHSHD